jgi:DNA-3-methyladenine glycosylase II
MRTFHYTTVETDALGRQDPLLGEAIARIGRIDREVNPDRFCALVESIVSQQISARAAETVLGRITAAYGGLDAVKLSSAGIEDIQRHGMSLRKAGYIRNLSEQVVSGRLDLAALSGRTDGEIVATLAALPGIGIWTAEMFLIFSMERPDVISWGDLAIRRGMMRLYGMEKLTKADFETFRKRYSPFGSVASLYLWALSHE